MSNPPPTGAARAEIHKELSKARTGLRQWSKKVNNRTLAVARAPIEQQEKLRANLNFARQREGELRDLIQEFETSLYGDWAPQNRPDPERSLDIARAAGIVKGE